MKDVLSGAARFLLHAALFAVVVVIMRSVLKTQSTPAVSALLILGPFLLVYPILWVGRRWLDAHPDERHAADVTAIVHFALMALFGTAIVEAVQTGPTWRGWTIPVSEEVGLTLLLVTGGATLLTVGNLALRGLGAPFAIALSRHLATDWMYRWTRNPMVLATLACLVSYGVWIRSGLFVLWVLLVLAPAWLAFVKHCEERELEIRFGASYREYRARTSMLLPWRPRR